MNRKVLQQVAYMCPICRTTSFDEKKIQKCANGHLEIVGLAVKYHDYQPIPQLWVTYSNGVHRIYERSILAEPEEFDDQWLHVFGTDHPNEK